MSNRSNLRAVPDDSTHESASMPPRRRTFRLTTARAVRRELAVLYHELRNGELDIETTKAAAHVLRCISESLRLAEFEDRLDQLEDSTQ